MTRNLFFEKRIATHDFRLGKYLLRLPMWTGKEAREELECNQMLHFKITEISHQE
ncbi:MAG TPA: hypothetical protein PLK76_00310 [bacterium]|nr:hypothetical protein [bacterium]